MNHANKISSQDFMDEDFGYIIASKSDSFYHYFLTHFTVFGYKILHCH